MARAGQSKGAMQHESEIEQAATRRREAARQRLLLALDVADVAAARALVQRTAPQLGGIKIGKELFTRGGPEAVRELGKSGLPVFLDLKFHDIPNTVARAVEAAGALGARWLSLHTSGGAAMLEAAAEARDALLPEQRPLLLGVTVLTSLDLGDPEEVVDRALLAARCRLDGAIASPQELVRLREVCDPGFLLVTPGVRPAGAAVNDQARVATPADAIRDGASLLVVGRPIHAAADPARAAASIVDAIATAMESPRAPTPRPRDLDVTAFRLQHLLRETGAFLEGHFILSSGLHSDRYVQCAQLLQHPHLSRRAGTWLAERLRPYRPEVVISVALGGLVIGQDVAAALGVRAVFAERDGAGTLRLRRGFALRPGERVAIVDDVCTRGGSIAECAEVVRAEGGTSVVSGAIIDRSGGVRGFELPFEALLAVEAQAFQPEECSACKTGAAAVKPGSRRKG